MYTAALQTCRPVLCWQLGYEGECWCPAISCKVPQHFHALRINRSVARRGCGDCGVADLSFNFKYVEDLTLKEDDM